MRLTLACRVALLAGLGAAAFVGKALAAPPITITDVDPPGQGFKDATPRSPEGGNMGATVGAQRLNAFRIAAERWAAALEGSVPIVIEASFSPLDCVGGDIVLGQASPAQAALVPGASGQIWAPIALANHIAGMDLDPGEADILAEFNGDLAGCTGGRVDWYYGYDARGGDNADLVEVVLHELGHGLGFGSFVDDNGMLLMGMLDTFSQHAFDVGVGQSWQTMTSAQRATSMRSARRLSWDGQNVTRQAASIMAKGSPLLGTAPAIAGLAGHVSEADFGRFVAAGAVSGPLAAVNVDPTTCGVAGSLAGRVVLFATPNCAAIQASFMAQTAGAAAVLIAGGASPPFTVGAPPSHRAMFSLTIPVLRVSTVDGTALAAAGSPTVNLTANGSRMLGGDEAGRMHLFASNPILVGSTVSHWDPLSRPDLLLEPVAGLTTHDMRMELALFRDIGWRTICGNGTMNTGEACDQGADNGAPTATCRPDCTLVSAGTGGSGGSGPEGSGGSGPGGNGGAGSGSGGSGALDASTDQVTPGDDPGGCGCAVSGGASGGIIAAALGLFGAVAASRRTRRRGAGRTEKYHRGHDR